MPPAARPVGYSTECPVGQRLRDVIGLEIGDGTAQIIKLVIARPRLGRALAPEPAHHDTHERAPTMGKLDNKIAIVTGAGQGIGKAIAEKLAAEGATVVVTDINEATAKETASAHRRRRGRHPHRRDLAGLGRRHGGAGAAAQFGRIDVLVNNAGWDKGGAVRRLRPRRLGPRHRDQPLRGPQHLQGGAADDGRAGLRDAWSTSASDAGRVGSSGEAVYSAAKGGVIAFTKATAREMARQQVDVNCVCPGPTDTALFASHGRRQRSCARR